MTGTTGAQRDRLELASDPSYRHTLPCCHIVETLITAQLRFAQGGCGGPASSLA